MRSRKQLISDLVRMGHKVFCIVPQEEGENRQNEFGAEFYCLPLQKTGFNPFSDLKFLLKLITLFRRLKIDMTIVYTIKPVIYCSLAAKIAGVKHISSVITGLGYAFVNNSFHQKFAGFIASNLYKIALACNQKVFFLNPDDRDQFLKIGAVTPKQCAIINGPGVDLDHFNFSPLTSKKTSFVLIARMLKEKGILEFVEAANQVKKAHPEIEFNIVGPIDTGPSAISAKKLEEVTRQGLVQYRGYTDDVRNYLRDSTVYVLPSYYREGIPRTNLEAMSVGRAIITTDTPGCRETVQDGKNGFLIPPRNSNALAEAMLKFIEDPELAVKMGSASRKFAEKCFAVNSINQSMMSYLDLLET